MKVKRIGLFLVVLILIISAIGCKTPNNVVPSVFTGTAEFNWGAGITVGNRTYLPMNVAGYPAQYAKSILQILDNFEKDYPELEITSWTIEKQQGSETRTDHIFGIWVNHRPKR